MDGDEHDRIAILEQVAVATERARDDLVLCGGMAAFAICQRAAAEADVAITEDVDLAVERVRHRQKTKPDDNPLLGSELQKHGFNCSYSSLPIGGGQPMDKWVKPGESFYLEFLTEDPKQQVHKISGILAQGLSYFSMSLANTFLFELPSGKSIRVVSPEAFVMHKLLTFNRRREGFKKYKDLYYVAIVALTAYVSVDQVAADMRALSIVPGWQKAAATNIKTIMKNLDDWIETIRGNDPAGYLTNAKIKNVFGTIAAAYENAEFPPNDASAAQTPTKICGSCGKFFRTGGTDGSDKCEACVGIVR